MVPRFDSTSISPLDQSHDDANEEKHLSLLHTEERKVKKGAVQVCLLWVTEFMVHLCVHTLWSGSAGESGNSAWTPGQRTGRGSRNTPGPTFEASAFLWRHFHRLSMGQNSVMQIKWVYASASQIIAECCVHYILSFVGGSFTLVTAEKLNKDKGFRRSPESPNPEEAA